jgi:hypothetical protein
MLLLLLLMHLAVYAVVRGVCVCLVSLDGVSLDGVSAGMCYMSLRRAGRRTRRRGRMRCVSYVRVMQGVRTVRWVRVVGGACRRRSRRRRRRTGAMCAMQRRMAVPGAVR